MHRKPKKKTVNCGAIYRERIQINSFIDHKQTLKILQYE